MLPQNLERTQSQELSNGQVHQKHEEIEPAMLIFLEQDLASDIDQDLAKIKTQKQTTVKQSAQTTRRKNLELAINPQVAEEISNGIDTGLFGDIA